MSCACQLWLHSQAFVFGHCSSLGRLTPTPGGPEGTSPSPSSNYGAAVTSTAETKAFVSVRDYSSYLAHYFYPRRLQRHYLALRAFNAELASIKETVSSEILGRIRIGWWRDAIRGCYNKRPPKHPVALALAEAIHDPAVLAQGGLVQDHFQRIISAREDDLAAPLTPPTLEDMEEYAEATSSRLYYLSLNLLGYDARSTDEIFSHLGKASGLTLQLASRRLMLPHEHLLAHRVVEEDVYRNGGRAQGVRDAVFETATRANDYLITARTLIRDSFRRGTVPEQLAGPLVGAVPARYYLEQLEKHDFDPFHPALQAVAAGRDWKLAWAMWRTSRSRNI
ncbi:hypothetical protein K437DRAFT_288568 [Tilletiaria anomala UBC 951]|uniref:Terpenoid synthase n=1 Tax=Tilletiaria anomala (strain ATCC 24038 / CBS 436.72 / UBC 951) TaxID=1037660 RepID=A0A066VLT1_TILAU|nr:uncharacterized protein K437DRAFT_288568 [Tilletiaria anomala UBC 951]KDN41238.1 hypothetical protein K437DRAFT_288568 [Tilletiaria anomala UBC 951]